MSALPSIAILLLAVSSLVISGAVQAQEKPLPDQMIYGGLEGDPISDPRSAPVRLTGSWLRLPDQRDAQVYRISWWTKVANAHGAQIAMDYVGLQSQSKFRYGGGRMLIRWTSRVFPLNDFSIALDLAGNLPLGEETLFPLSARAPMGIVRPRVSLARIGFARFWVGWWARRSSPPSEANRQDPLSGFASGTGFDALMEWRISRIDVDWMLHLPTGGEIDRVFHWSVAADSWFGEEVALRTGFAFDTGPRTDRSYDWMASLGITWRPLADDQDERD
jgi:hypothetical protein